MTSSTTRSGLPLAAPSSRSSAASPVSTTSTPKPSASRLNRSTSARCCSSSTISTRLFTSGPDGPRQQNGEGAAAPRALALREGAPAVPPRNGSNDEESQPAAFGPDGNVRGNSIEAPEDPLEIDGRDAGARVRHLDSQPALVLLQDDAYVNVRPRVLHGVVDQIPDRCLELVGVAYHDRAVPADAIVVGQRTFVETEARPGELHALARDVGEIDACSRDPPPAGAGAAGAKHLLDGVQQAVAVLQHDPVELLPSPVVQLPCLERLEVQADGCDGRLQFVGDGVNEGVVLLVAADLADEEDRIEDHARDDDKEDDDAQDREHAPAPVEDDPADVQGDGERDQADAENREEDDRPATAADHASQDTAEPPGGSTAAGHGRLYAASSRGSAEATFAT